MHNISEKSCIFVACFCIALVQTLLERKDIGSLLGI